MSRPCRHTLLALARTAHAACEQRGVYAACGVHVCMRMYDSIHTHLQTAQRPHVEHEGAEALEDLEAPHLGVGEQSGLEQLAPVCGVCTGRTGPQRRCHSVIERVRRGVEASIVLGYYGGMR